MQILRFEVSKDIVGTETNIANMLRKIGTHMEVGIDRSQPLPHILIESRNDDMKQLIYSVLQRFTVKEIQHKN